MTGETNNVTKNEANPWMLSGCQVVEGRGSMLVVAVGPNSQWGIAQRIAIEDGSETPLQERLEHLAESIGKLGLLAASLTFVIFS
jgi:magnesium-transporting ATPase (P-type)